MTQRRGAALMCVSFRLHPCRGGQRVRATGSPAPARYGGRRRPLLAPYEVDLERLVEAAPDITLAELQAALQRRFGIVAGLSTIHNTLRRIGLRHKKSP
jgi:putative transposase